MRKGNYYQALYEWQDGEVAELQSVQVVNKQQLLENLALQGKPAVILGELCSLKAMELAGVVQPCARIPAPAAGSGYGTGRA